MMKLGKISLYGSALILLCGFLMALFIGVGIKGIFIIIAFCAGLSGILYLLFRMLPEVWAIAIIFIGLTIFAHYVVQSWILSVGLLLLILFYVLFHFLHLTKKWKGSMLIIYSIAMSVGLFLYSEYMPEIKQEVFDEVSEEMLEDSRIEDIRLETDEEYVGADIHCLLVIKDDVPLKERTKIGESCAEKVSSKVKAKEKRFNGAKSTVGKLYDYYELEIDILSVDNGEWFHTWKHSTDSEVDWYVNRHAPLEKSDWIENLQEKDLDGKEFTMTASYDGYHLDFKPKDIHIHFNSSVAIVQKDGETTEYNYSLSDETKIVFENHHEQHEYNLDLMTQDEVLFLEGDKEEGTGYIFKME